MGAQLTALDLYWANMSQVIDPLAGEESQLSFSAIWAPVRAAVESAIDPILYSRDFIFAQHLTLPLDF